MSKGSRVPIRVPDMGLESDRPLTVSMWFASVGELVLEGDRLVELLADDVTFDITAPVTGRLVAVERDLEETVEPGETLGWLEAAPDEEPW